MMLSRKVLWVRDGKNTSHKIRLKFEGHIIVMSISPYVVNLIIVQTRQIPG